MTGYSITEQRNSPLVIDDEFRFRHKDAVLNNSTAFGFIGVKKTDLSMRP